MQLVARETLPQLIEEPEPVQRQGLLQALLEGACRLAVDLLQLSVKTGKPLFGRLVGRFLVSPLEPGSPSFLVGLRKVTDDIFPLVPPTALNLSSVSEDLANGLAQALAAIDDAKNAVVEAEATPDKVPQQLSDRLSSLGCRLCKPENLLVAFLGDSHAEGLPVPRRPVSHGLRAPGSSLPLAIGSRTPPGPAGPAPETAGSSMTGSGRTRRQTGWRPPGSLLARDPAKWPSLALDLARRFSSPRSSPESAPPRRQCLVREAPPVGTFSPSIRIDPEFDPHLRREFPSSFRL